MSSWVVAVASTQEEVGSGVTVANDVPGVSAEEQVTRLGYGPAIKVMDTTQISDRASDRQMRQVARDLHIPIWMGIFNHRGTDASLIQRLRVDVAVCTLSIPARDIHPVNETVANSGVDQAVTLLTGYLGMESFAS